VYANSVHSPEAGPPFVSAVDVCAEEVAAAAAAAEAAAGAGAGGAGAGAGAPAGGLRNTHPEFVGAAKMKELLQKQVASFRAWAARGEWEAMHDAHYDWWAAPLPDKSSRRYAFSVFPGDVAALAADPAYMAALEEGLTLLARGWGWDVVTDGPIPDAVRSPEQVWRRWPIRLFKMAVCADTFGLARVAASLRKFGGELLAEGEVFSYAGHDLSWAFRPPFTRPKPVDYGLPAAAGGGGAGGAPHPPAAVDPSYVHVLWGASKDLCMSGYRVGVLHTVNPALLTALANVNYFATVSNDTQDALAQLLSDEPWVDAFLAENNRLLRESYATVAEAAAAAGIPHVRPAAGMFAWLDLRGLILTPPPAGGAAGGAAAAGGRGAAAGGARPSFDPERQLTDDMFEQARILFTPGEACHADEPGFFRCCFAWMRPESVRAGFARLAEFGAARRAAGGGGGTAAGGAPVAAGAPVVAPGAQEVDNATME
jgi:hypothetical protein